MKKLVLYISVFILSIYIVSAVCTVTLDKESYNKGETAVASMQCDDASQKSKSYVLNWTNMTGIVELEVDTGTTPTTVNEIFLETFTITSGYTGNGLNASLTVNDVWQAYDNATVSAAGTNDIVITAVTVAGKWLGLTSSVTATVTDENSKKLSGGQCKMSIWSNDETQMLATEDTKLYYGELKASWTMGYESFSEGVDYKVKVICFCGTNSSINECVDEDGNIVTNSNGITTGAFNTNTWLTINEDPMPITYENGSDYTNPNVFAGFGEEAFYKINVTNNKLEDVKLEVLTFLVSNDTGAVFQEPDAQRKISKLGGGNSSGVGMHIITKEAQSGVYYIKKFYDVIYNNIVVSQGVVNTESFNITGTDDSFVLRNILTDKFNYYTGESIHVCVNLSNSFDTRVEFQVEYNFRCGSNNLDGDTDRSLVGQHVENRALSADTTQNQCAELYIGYPDHMLYKKTQCYASVTVNSPYIDTFDNKKSITSPNFNITDYGMYPEYEIDATYPLIRLFPDWRRFDDLIDSVNRSYYRAKINITDLDENFVDPDDKIRDNKWDVYVVWTQRMPCSQEMYNYTVLNLTGGVADNSIENKALIWKKNENGEKIESYCSIGIEDVNFSDPNDDYFEVRVWFEDFKERQTEALEGIENKTGTFHFDIDCPSTISGNSMECVITAYIESGEVQKEVDFNCYIDDGKSPVNFNHMITATPQSLQRSFDISSLGYTSHTVTCSANYYNLGSRSDTFADSFTKVAPAESSVTGSAGKQQTTENTLDKLKKKFAETTKSEWLIIATLLCSAMFVFTSKQKQLELIKKQEDETKNKLRNNKKK